MVFCMQYLKNFQTRQVPILERFALLITTTVIWAYAHLLTASGAYKHRPDVTQHSCRTDRANLISSAPWLVPIAYLWLNICILCINVAKKILTLEHVGAG
jgi:nucleobase transporter 1/2